MSNLIWLDLETSGLDVRECVVLELGMIVTDQYLDIKEEFVRIVHQPEDVLESMTAWCINQHGASGLTVESKKAIQELPSVEQDAIDFVEAWFPPATERPVMCGNTIGFDREFLKFQAAGLHDQFHYRSIDVSGIKTLARLWFPEIPILNLPGSHRTISDLHDSINELKYYREHVFARP